MRIHKELPPAAARQEMQEQEEEACQDMHGLAIAHTKKWSFVFLPSSRRYIYWYAHAVLDLVSQRAKALCTSMTPT